MSLFIYIKSQNAIQKALPFIRSFIRNVAAMRLLLVVQISWKRGRGDGIFAISRAIPEPMPLIMDVDIQRQ